MKNQEKKFGFPFSSSHWTSLENRLKKYKVNDLNAMMDYPGFTGIDDELNRTCKDFIQEVGVKGIDFDDFGTIKKSPFGKKVKKIAKKEYRRRKKHAR